MGSIQIRPPLHGAYPFPLRFPHSSYSAQLEAFSMAKASLVGEIGREFTPWSSP